MRKAAPAFYALAGGFGEMLLRAPGDDGHDARHAEFGSLFDGPLHAVEFEDREQQGDGQRRLGGDLFEEGEGYFFNADADDGGTIDEAVGDNVRVRAGLCSKDASEMSGLCADEACGGVGEGIGDPAASGHARIIIILLSATDARKGTLRASPFLLPFCDACLMLLTYSP